MSARPALRLFDPVLPAPSSESTDESPTLRAIYERWIRPDQHGQRAVGTVDADLSALDRWERVTVILAKNPRTQSPGVLWTADPPVAQVTSEMLTAVRNALLDGADGELSTDSVRKVLTTVRKCLRRADRERLIPGLPQFPEIRPTRRRPGLVDLEEVDALYRAADAATWPRLRGKVKQRGWWLEPAHWWRTWLVMFWVYGARTQDFVGYKTAGDRGLCWSAVTDGERCPDPSIRKLSCPHGWIEFLPAKTQRTRDETLLLPRCEIVNQHLDLFRGVCDTRCFPNGRSKTAFRAAWSDIRKAADLPDDVTISDTGQRHGRKTRSIRKGCSNNWDDVLDGLGGWVLGHTPQGTNATSYKLALPKIVELIDELALPPAFSECPEDRPSRRQGQLF